MRTRLLPALALIVGSVHAQVGPSSQMPSAGNYFHFAAMEQLCRSGKGEPNEVVEAYRQHTLQYLDEAAKSDSGQVEAASSDAQKVRANLIPQEVQSKLAKAMQRSRPNETKIACMNAPAIIQNQMAMEKLAVLQSGSK